MRAVRCSWSAWAAPRQRYGPFMLPQVVAWRRDRRSWSPSGSRCRCHGVLALGHGTVCFVSLELGAFMLSLPLLCEELAVILVDRCGCGAHANPCEATTYVLLPLGSSWPSTGSVWWRSGPWFDPGLLAWTYHCLRLGDWPWALLPRSYAYHPPPSRGMARLGVHVCLHILKCCLYYFLEILDFIS